MIRTLARVFVSVAVACGVSKAVGEDRTLVISGIVHAPAEEVFHSFTTPEGIVKAWGVAKARVDFRVGGQIRTAYRPDADLDSPGAIVNTILAYEPGRMLSFKSTAPEGAPDWLRAICDSGWWVIRLEPIAPDRTRYTETGMGFKDGPLFDRAYEFFKQGNASTLKHMQDAFAPAADADQRAFAILKSFAGDWISETTRPDGGLFRARTRWELIMDGRFIQGAGWLGDQDGVHPHALYVTGIDPATGGLAFWNFGEKGDIARGHIRLVNDTTVACDWTTDAPGESGPTRRTWHVELSREDADHYRIRMFDTPADAAAGKPPQIDVLYTRVAEVPERFRTSTAPASAAR